MLDLSQLSFDFAAQPRWEPFRSVREMEPAGPPPAVSPVEAIPDGRDEALEEQTRGWLVALEMPGGAKLVTVSWNARLRSTAGYARYPSWAIELNPRLREFEGQVERTLKHELAHLIAYHRAGRRRIEPHGREWRVACADLGIADEKAHHRLPLPRNEVERKLTYACPACQTTVQRVRKFRRPTACLHCCNRHAGGKYDGRFKLVLVGGK
ncbi:MAG: SprT-like domain-containing protein [Prosthecobacter sp.]